jgi:hypothetical protein
MQEREAISQLWLRIKIGGLTSLKTSNLLKIGTITGDSSQEVPSKVSKFKKRYDHIVTFKIIEGKE